MAFVELDGRPVGGILYDRTINPDPALVDAAGRVGNTHLGDDLDDIRRGLDDSVTELRWLVQRVMPALLMDRGLMAAVEDLADRVPIRTVLQFGDLDASTRERFPELVEGTAYAVIAEALTNAVTHSAATLIVITVGREQDYLRVQVADEGVGGVAPAGRMGLRGMTDRVQALGGRLEIESPPAVGTRVVAELPFAA